MTHPGFGSVRIARVIVRAALFAAILLALTGLSGSWAATPTSQLNAAGLVIQHGDGSVLYFYVQFSDSAVAATDLLQRAGVSTEEAPYAGIGIGICRIDGEGCPASNCFCKSYSNPSFYWRYEKLTSSGSWLALPYGANQKSIHNGDVVGFSWSDKDGDLPSVTLERIEQLNGVAPTPAVPTTPVPSPTPRPTATPTATKPAATATHRATAVPSPTRAQTGPAPTATPTPERVPTSSVTSTEPPESATVVVMAAPSPTRVATESLSTTTSIATAIARGVVVAPSGTPTAISATPRKGGGSSAGYVWFGASALLLLLVGGFVMVRRRGSSR